jgi:branched-chain amino acid transport system permease protein
MQRVTQLLRRRGEVLALLALTGAVLAWCSPFPAGLVALGAVGGGLMAMQAVGLVLVFRSNRIINFAQLQIGAVAAIVFTHIVNQRLLIRALHAVCASCVPGPQITDAVVQANPSLQQLAAHDDLSAVGAALLAPSWMLALEYWVAVVLGVGLAVGLMAALYFGVIRRLVNAPRLVLSIAVIGVGQFALTLTNLLADWLLKSPTEFVSPSGLQVPLPLHASVGGGILGTAVQLRSTDIVVLLTVAAALLGLLLVFRRTSGGMALRAASDEPERAETLGINVNRVHANAWMASALIGGLAAILAAADGVNAGGYDQLVGVLAAATVGAMTVLPAAIAGALALGVMAEAIVFHSGSTGLLSGLYLALIVVVLLVRRRRRQTRTDSDSETGWTGGQETRPTPAVLAALAPVRTAYGTVAAVVVLVVVAFPFVVSPANVVLGISAAALGMVALSLLVLTGWAGRISLGQLALAGVGAYVAAVSGLPMLPALLVGGLAGTVAAIVVGVPALRLGGIYLAVATLALGLAVSTLLLGGQFLGHWLPSSLARPVLLGLNLDDDRTFYYFGILCLAATFFAVMGLRRSWFGRALISARDNERAALSMGINLFRLRLAAFAVSGFIAGLAGVVTAYGLRGVDVGSFGVDQNIAIFLLLVIGGANSLAGPLLGSGYELLVAIGQTGPLARLFNVLASPGLGVVLVVLFCPGGLAQLGASVRDAWLRRLAGRRRIPVPSLTGDAEATGRRAPIAARRHTGGSEVYVPRRFTPAGQWLVEARQAELVEGGRR